MVNLKEILSASNVMILVIMAGGNFIFGLASYFQEFGKMDCVRQAIYQKATQDAFLTCLNNRGLLDVGGITWIGLQFGLIVASVLIAYWIEKK